MVIWMIFTILCVIVFAIFSGLAICNYIDKKIPKMKKKVVWILLFFALTVTSFLTMYHGSTDHIGDGTVVAYIYSQTDSSRQALYYSERHNDYFVINTNLYNVFDLAERDVIQTEIAEKYIEVYNQLNSIDVKGNNESAEKYADAYKSLVGALKEGQ